MKLLKPMQVQVKWCHDSCAMADFKNEGSGFEQKEGKISSPKLKIL